MSQAQIFKDFDPLFGEYLTQTAGEKLGALLGCSGPVTFETVPYLYDGSSATSVLRELFVAGGIDFAIADRVVMACLGQEFHIKELLSIAHSAPPSQSMCPLIFTRADSSIRGLKDFAGKVCLPH